VTNPRHLPGVLAARYLKPDRDGLIGEISPLQQVGGAKRFSILCAATALIFFIAGLLYLLCFERVDNLGAYSIPSETGFLVPSVIAN
jgi:hypothetical protein